MKLTCVTAVFNVVAAGNRERLVRCVESIAALKTEHEHLIYDGASTDGTVDLLHELASKYPSMRFVSEKDSGIYNALNKGVRDALGDWFYVLGCDDYLDKPEVLDQLLLDVNPKTQVCASPVTTECGGKFVPMHFVRRNLYFGMPYCHQGVLIRTEFLRAMGGFDERYRISADYDLILKYHLAGAKIHFFSKRYAVFHIGGASGRVGSQDSEAFAIACGWFGLEGVAAELFKTRLSLPWDVVLRYVFHRDATIRISMLFSIARAIVGCLRR